MNIIQILKTALKSLQADLKNTLINILGLGGGLTIFILIVLFVWSQYSFNSHIPHSGELFRYERGLQGITNALEASPIAARTPEITDYCRIASQSGTLFYRPDNGNPARANVTVLLADSSFLDMFGIQVIERTAGSPLKSPSSALVSRELADILFGPGGGPGEIVSYDHRQDLMVEGVFESLPTTSAFEFDVILLLDYLVMESGNPHYLENPGMWRYETYFRMEPSGKSEVTGKLPDMIRELYSGTGAASFHEDPHVTLRPLGEIYFSGTGGLHKLGDRNNTLIFMIIAGFVLIIAAINFINLSTARSARRSKETGLRKILGSGRTSLIMQICAEGAITIFISLALALAVSELLLPWYSGFVGASLSIDYSNPGLLLLIILVPLLLGILSGIFPAWYLSRVSPVSVLRKELNTGRKGRGLRTVLTVFQFSISTFLITGTLIINRQLRFINDYDPGFLTENIIEVRMNDQIYERFDVFKQTVLSDPSVRGITRTNQPLYSARSVWTVLHEDKNFTWTFLQVDEDFSRVFGLNILAGQDFSDDMLQRGQMVFLINEAAAGAFESNEILNERINGHEIMGIVKDFHTASLKSEMVPVTIALAPNGARGYVYIDTGHGRAGLDFISDTWNELSPDYPFEYTGIRERIDNAYIPEKRFSELFIYFSLASILISCLGLFALASFTSESRIREISLRKVHGASTVSISMLLSYGLTGKVLIANLVAWPVAWFFIRGWLQNFAYRISPGMGEFLLAAVIAQIIALGTVSWHVYSTARKSPAEVLKYE